MSQKALMTRNEALGVIGTVAGENARKFKGDTEMEIRQDWYTSQHLFIGFKRAVGVIGVEAWPLYYECYRKARGVQ